MCVSKLFFRTAITSTAVTTKVPMFAAKIHVQDKLQGVKVILILINRFKPLVGASRRRIHWKKFRRCSRSSGLFFIGELIFFLCTHVFGSSPDQYSSPRSHKNPRAIFHRIPISTACSPVVSGER